MCSCTLSPNEHQKGEGGERGRGGKGKGVQLHAGYLASTAGEVVPAHGTTKDRSGNIFFSLYHQVTWTMATHRRGGEVGRSMAGYPTILSQVSLKLYPCSIIFLGGEGKCTICTIKLTDTNLEQTSSCCHNTTKN